MIEFFFIKAINGFVDILIAYGMMKIDELWKNKRELNWDKEERECSSKNNVNFIV